MADYRKNFEYDDDVEQFLGEQRCVVQLEKSE
jgi:hypothetical protein